MNPIDLNKLMIQLGEEKVDSVFIEGGAFTHGKAFESGIVDKVYAYIAPKIIGGKDALTPIAGEGVSLMKDAYVLKNIKYHYFGDNLMIEGNINKDE
jgi:diaminohydroxyphosphoribosylaminopyrimidine deaminase/5-amino-6-(5-phosphoribosylamino)uracil reductase